jgi:hypothetical protein
MQMHRVRHQAASCCHEATADPSADICDPQVQQCTVHRVIWAREGSRFTACLLPKLNYLHLLLPTASRALGRVFAHRNAAVLGPCLSSQ